MNIVGYKSTQKNGTKTYMSEIVVKKRNLQEISVNTGDVDGTCTASYLTALESVVL